MADQKADEGASSFRIEYFPFGGGSEAIKLAASINGLAFETKMVTFEQLTAKKKAGKCVWFGLPEMTLLDKEGKDVATLAQSNACLRFVGLCLFAPSTFCVLLTYIKRLSCGYVPGQCAGTSANRWHS